MQGAGARSNGGHVIERGTGALMRAMMVAVPYGPGGGATASRARQGKARQADEAIEGTEKKTHPTTTGDAGRKARRGSGLD